MDEYLRHLETTLRQVEGTITPDVLSSIRRQIVAIFGGYELLGKVEIGTGRTLQDAIGDAQTLATVQRFSPDVQLIPDLCFGYGPKGQCSVGVLSWRYNVYARRETGTGAPPSVDSGCIDQMVIRLLQSNQQNEPPTNSLN